MNVVVLRLCLPVCLPKPECTHISIFGKHHVQTLGHLDFCRCMVQSVRHALLNKPIIRSRPWIQELGGSEYSIPHCGPKRAADMRAKIMPDDE
jgi:hypothetical protein